MVPERTDAHLIQLVLAGDRDACNEFVELFQKLIYSVLIRQCGIPEDLQEDAFQYVFVKLFEDDCRRLSSWRGESAFSTFLYIVVRNLGRDFREKELKHEGRMIQPGDDGGEDMREDGAPTPEDEVAVNNMEEVVRDLVESLEEVCRKIIDLKFTKDMSYKEISLAVGITANYVGVRLSRCLDALTQLMKREFPDLFEDRFNLDM